jgi:hypothetical protein
MAKTINKTTYINTELEYNLAFFSGVYKITNLINGKFYIGSSKSLYKRLSEHFEKLKKGTHKNPHLQSSYLKYGNVFKHEILKICKPEEIFEVEQYYLDVLKPEYNINKLATGRHGPLRKETIEKISASRHKAIEQYDEEGNLIAEYKCINDIFIKFNINKTGAIVDHLKGRQRIFQGYFWCYKGKTPLIRKKRNRWQH